MRDHVLTGHFKNTLAQWNSTDSLYRSEVPLAFETQCVLLSSFFAEFYAPRD
jgi:hypothetical protein